MRESGADFSTYLGNGEPLTRRTRIVPKGRGPFKTWEDGAVDALRFDSLDDVLAEDWTIEGVCLRLREVQRLRLPQQEDQLAVPVVEVEQLQPRQIRSRWQVQRDRQGPAGRHHADDQVE